MSGNGLHVQKAGKQVTHSLHADVVYNLSGSRHIAAALNTFGITKTTSDLLIARFAATGMPLFVILNHVCGPLQPPRPDPTAAQLTNRSCGRVAGLMERSILYGCFCMAVASLEVPGWVAVLLITLVHSLENKIKTSWVGVRIRVPPWGANTISRIVHQHRRRPCEFHAVV